MERERTLFKGNSTTKNISTFFKIRGIEFPHPEKKVDTTVLPRYTISKEEKITPRQKEKIRRKKKANYLRKG